MVTASPLCTVRRGASFRSCGRASSKPGTRMKAIADTAGSSGCRTTNGTMRLRSPIVTRIRLSSRTSAPPP
jgi:hypothetical protein